MLDAVVVMVVFVVMVGCCGCCGCSSVDVVPVVLAVQVLVSAAVVAANSLAARCHVSFVISSCVEAASIPFSPLRSFLSPPQYTRDPCLKLFMVDVISFSHVFSFVFL